jgi:hypothetical protein
MTGVRVMEMITMAEATQQFLGRCRDGHVSVATVCRWMKKGIDGIRLQSKRVGGQRYTTVAWCHEFIANLNATPEPPPQQWPMPNGVRHALENHSGADVIDGEYHVVETTVVDPSVPRREWPRSSEPATNERLRNHPHTTPCW